MTQSRTFTLTIPYAHSFETSELEGVRRFQFTDPQGERWEIMPAQGHEVGFMIRKLDYGAIAAVGESSNQLRIVGLSGNMLIGSGDNDGEEWDERNG